MCPLLVAARQISRGGCDAVAGRGNDGDAIGRAVKELRGGRAKFFRIGEELIGRNLPRVCFAGKPRGSGLQCQFRRGDM